MNIPPLQSQEVIKNNVRFNLTLDEDARWAEAQFKFRIRSFPKFVRDACFTAIQLMEANPSEFNIKRQPRPRGKGTTSKSVQFTDADFWKLKELSFQKRVNNVSDTIRQLVNLYLDAYDKHHKDGEELAI